MLTRTDLLVSHELALASTRRIRFELNVQNVFNQKTATHIFNFLQPRSGRARASSAINLASTDLTKGYDYNALIKRRPTDCERLRSALRGGRPVPSRARRVSSA